MLGVVYDLEGTGLLGNMLSPEGRIHCLMAQEVYWINNQLTTGHKFEFYDPALIVPDSSDWRFVGNVNTFFQFASRYDFASGHNVIEYDIPILEHHIKSLWPKGTSIVDSIVISRKNYPDRPGGHSVEAWGNRLGHKKHKQDEWHTFTDSVRTRCREDTLIETKILEKVLIEHLVNEEKCK